MNVTVTIADGAGFERSAFACVSFQEVRAVHLHVAYPEKRNRTGLYMRRHRQSPSGEGVGPNAPLRSGEEPPKLTISEHLALMRRAGLLPMPSAAKRDGNETYRTEPAMLAVPISDLVANLLRPCFHRDRLGPYRTFFFEDEPIRDRSYWCICAFGGEAGKGRLEFRELVFDAYGDRVLSAGGDDLANAGLIWAAGVVPLVRDGRALSPVEIAQNDYDLRQVLGRSREDEISLAYDGWPGEWNARVEALVKEQIACKGEFARFYHSVLGVDGDGNIHIWQLESTLPDIAEKLAKAGMASAGLLDSGGSCALYDVWLDGYLNHGWYLREPRGAILVIETRTALRLPAGNGASWTSRRVLSGAG